MAEECEMKKVTPKRRRAKGKKREEGSATMMRRLLIWPLFGRFLASLPVCKDKPLIHGHLGRWSRSKQKNLSDERPRIASLVKLVF